MNTRTLSQRPVQWVLLSVLGLWLAGCGSRSGEKSQKTGDAAAVGIQIVPVQVAVAARKNLAVTKTFTGSLEGEDQANIVAKISERITGINIHVGESVPAGHVAMNLDKSGTSSQFYQAEANFKNAEKTLERMKSLYNEGAVSLQALDAGQTAYDVARANFDAARSAVELTNPISGVVTAVNVNTGDLATPGAVLATIANIHRMKIIFNINETDVMDLSLGQKVWVHSEAGSGGRLEGRIVQLSNSADIRSRSFQIKALFPNTPEYRFKPGMFCKVDIDLTPRVDALVVPNSAILSDGLANRVYLIRKGRSWQRVVQPGITDGEYTEIVQGLADHDTVATIGLTSVKDSSHVTIVNRPN
jgi:membrane fusion protein, multidrug efflux system